MGVHAEHRIWSFHLKAKTTGVFILSFLSVTGQELLGLWAAEFLPLSPASLVLLGGGGGMSPRARESPRTERWSCWPLWPVMRPRGIQLRQLLLWRDKFSSSLQIFGNSVFNDLMLLKWQTRQTLAGRMSFVGLFQADGKIPMAWFPRLQTWGGEGALFISD